MAENPRTTSARDHDDSELIEGMETAGGAVPSSSGGRLQTDVGSQNDLVREIGDPDALTRPQKDDDINNNQAYRNARTPDA
jgi:hypothetical protein